LKKITKKNIKSKNYKATSHSNDEFQVPLTVIDRQVIIEVFVVAAIITTQSRATPARHSLASQFDTRHLILGRPVRKDGTKGQHSKSANGVPTQCLE